MNELKKDAANPKDLMGSAKLPLTLWPVTATAMGCIALLVGKSKYGRDNFRGAPVRASIYCDALQRHMAAWFEGEELDPDDNTPHLGHALACIAIIIDAQAAGTLIDDRKIEGGLRNLMDFLTPLVPAIQAKYAGKSPRHYSIADNKPTLGTVRREGGL